MNHPTLSDALQAYKEKTYSDWTWFCKKALLIGIVLVSSIHAFQLKQYYTLISQSSYSLKKCGELKALLQKNSFSLPRCKLLKQLASLSSPLSIYNILSTLSTTTPRKVFLTSVKIGSSQTVHLTGFSPTKKELSLYMQALSKNSLFPCHPSLQCHSHPVGILFTLSLLQQEKPASSQKSVPTLSLSPHLNLLAPWFLVTKQFSSFFLFSPFLHCSFL